MYDFQGVATNGELNIKENEILNILRQDVGDGWWEAENSQGERGLVPEAYCEVCVKKKKKNPGQKSGKNPGIHGFLQNSSGRIQMDSCTW